MLEPVTVTAQAGGRVRSVLDLHQLVQQGDLVARLERSAASEGDDELVAVRAPVPGSVSDVLVSDGEEIVAGQPVVRLDPSLEHVRNAVMGLALVGTAEDVKLLRQIGDPRSGYADEIRASARWAAEQVRERYGDR